MESIRTARAILRGVIANLKLFDFTNHVNRYIRTHNVINNPSQCQHIYLFINELQYVYAKYNLSEYQLKVCEDQKNIHLMSLEQSLKDKEIVKIINAFSS